MKIFKLSRFIIFSQLFICLSAFSQGFQGLVPPNFDYLLDSWSFNDTTWVSDFGDGPLSFTNLNNLPGIDGNALQVDSTNAAWLQYNIVDGVATNLTLTEGTIELWVLPDWNSGTGPGDYGRLIDVGAYSTNSASSWWSLYFSPDGTSINFSIETNGVLTNILSYPISWDTNTWHLVDLAYAPFRVQLFIDGQLATNTGGILYSPNAEVVSNGFFVGSDVTGLQQSRALIDDLATYTYPLSEYEASNDYAAVMGTTGGGGFSPDDGGPVPPGFEGGGSGTGGSSYTPPNYGTNLWIQQYGITTNHFTGMLSNTIADVEYQLLSMTSLNCTQWTSQGFLLGSETTNWTPWSLPYSPTNDFFLDAVSWQDDSGTGIPDWWWLKYFGEDTNVDANVLDPAGDGWTDYQKFAMGISPSFWTTPPAPQGLTVFYNASNNTATVTWQASPGSVVSYTLHRTSFLIESGTSADFSVTTTNYTDNLPSISDQDIATYGPTPPIQYQVQANYAGGSSAGSYVVDLEKFSSLPSVNLVQDSAGNSYLNILSVPSGTVALKVTGLYVPATDNGNVSYNTNFNILLNSSSNGMYALANYFEPGDPNYGGYGYSESDEWFVQAVNANGSLSTVARVSNGYTPTANGGPTNSWLATPFYDGRAELKQNLIFLLRESSASGPFSYIPDNGGGSTVTEPSGYAYAGYYNTSTIWNGYEMTPPDHSLDVYRPFEENSVYANFVFNSGQIDSSGNIDTGVGLFGGYDLILTNSPTYQFNQPTTVGTTFSPQLSGSQWLVSFPYFETFSESDGAVFTDMEPIGIDYTYDSDSGVITYTLASSAKNYFGLTYGTAAYEYLDWDSDTLESGTISPGSSFGTASEPVFIYSQPAQPTFETVEYDFWNPAFDALPGDDNFSPTNTSRQTMIVSVGVPTYVAGYAKLAVENGYSGAYGYLGQYFDKAYQIDANGNVTTNSAGTISPYGQFCANVAGPAALVTMPDPDTGARGTGIVYAVKLQLDVNHDGNMDLTSYGPDNTFPYQPYELWANNNFDRLHTVDLSDSEQDDLQTAPQPDCNYTDALGFRTIPCQRDLEDYARLWICGVTSNLLAALPAGASITLSMNQTPSYLNNYTINSDVGQPTIDLFAAADLDGGIGYLTNSTIASNQINTTLCPFVQRFGPASSFELNNLENHLPTTHFIWCGVSNGIGQLTLTISDGSNIIGQTSTYIQVDDVKQMYERWTVGDNPNLAPANKAILATDGLEAGEQAFEYPLSTDTNTPYILHVHGWNMPSWEKDRYAESEFKRLYWQGYQGRFGELRWPTFYNFPLEAFQWQAADLQNYDNSEFNAWQSATGLLNLLTNLDTKYPGQVYITAHSMGNVVAGEALRLAGTNRVVNTYVAMQGALPSQTYDPNATTRSIPSLEDNGTPNRYADYYTNGASCYFNGSAGAGTYVNFFNTNDYALNVNNWQLNQNLKPDFGYGYNSLDGFYEGVLTTTLLSFPTNTYLIFAHCDEARCYALGAQPNVGGVFSSNQVELDLPPYNFGNTHKYHSGEFRSDNAQRGGFWEQVLEKMGLK